MAHDHNYGNLALREVVFHEYFLRRPHTLVCVGE